MIEVYDSASNTWTQIRMTVPNSIRPFGRGVYFKGLFYWLSSFSNCGEVVGFDVQNRRWITIPSPSPFIGRDSSSILDFNNEESSTSSWELTGNEEKLVLVDKKFQCMWKLEDDREQWARVKINLPDTVHRVSVNSSGWSLVLGDKIYLYNEDGRIANTIELIEVDVQLLADIARYGNCIPALVSPFECNNVWWPS